MQGGAWSTDRQAPRRRRPSQPTGRRHANGIGPAMADLYRKRLESERKTLWATCRLKGLAKGTPERLRIAELDRLIAEHDGRSRGAERLLAAGVRKGRLPASRCHGPPPAPARQFACLQCRTVFKRVPQAISDLDPRPLAHLQGGSVGWHWIAELLFCFDRSKWRVASCEEGPVHTRRRALPRLNLIKGHLLAHSRNRVLSRFSLPLTSG